LGAGFTTVTLASILRRVLGGERLGLAIGLGTGAAYGLCNLPGVFTAGAAVQAGWALLAAGAGLTGTLGLAPGAPPPVPPGAGYARIGVTAWVAVLLALVFLDSAAFYIIQHTPALLADSWQGAGRLLANAAMHFVAAIAAGWLLDRGWVGGLTALGALLLLLACGLVASGHPIVAGTVLLYTAGVSIYSTVLVYYPAYGSRPWLAALVYAVAGWGGSALGIGLAQSRSALPPAIVVGAAAVIGAGLLVPRWCRRHLG
jgi:cytochrome c oxidase cbb3-type subunit 2